jgi:hypothetical protein
VAPSSTSTRRRASAIDTFGFHATYFTTAGSKTLQASAADYFNSFTGGPFRFPWRAQAQPSTPGVGNRGCPLD